MKVLKFIISVLVVSNLARAADFRIINESTEIINHQIATEAHGRAAEEASLKCKDPTKWICFDKCIAKSEKIIRVLKNDLTGEIKEDIKYKITFGLTTQKEDQWSDSDSVILSSSEFPLKNDFQRNEKAKNITYKSGVLKLDSNSIFCTLTDGCPIPVREYIRTRISVDELLSNVATFSIKTNYTLRMEKSSELTCNF